MKKIRSLFTVAALAVVAVTLSACSSTNKQQFTDSLSGKGLMVDASVPVPGTSYSIGVKSGLGVFNHTFAEQPVATNKLYSASMAVAAYGHGKQSVVAGSGTNSSAAVGQGTSDASVILFGNTTLTNQMGTNEVLTVDGTK